jgi:hypothetical protein
MASGIRGFKGKSAWPPGDVLSQSGAILPVFGIAGAPPCLRSAEVAQGERISKRERSPRAGLAAIPKASQKAADG